MSVTVLGTALVAAGLLAPATGEATATGHDAVRVEPEVAMPGQRVEVLVDGCTGGVRATSDAFAEGTTVHRDVKPGDYTVVARCAGRTVRGQVTVAGRMSWPTLLPTNR
ncbi:hypothetical protein [Actinomadura sp. BRA 177]|uniref:hypothetical protein n=1 Tax=Actinomadura sp. BRA 177 TaxID=2745202 RepID=UPI0015954920|nr:hypothetical protein [Actinomadura sp. BRA 177]